MVSASKYEVRRRLKQQCRRPLMKAVLLYYSYTCTSSNVGVFILRYSLKQLILGNDSTSATF